MDDLQYVSLIAIPHFEQLLELYRGEWWTAMRDADDVRRMLDATRVQVGLIDHQADQLVAFARVVTDETYCATLLDVIVRTDRRGRGFGDRIMALTFDHPRMANLRCPVRLTCRESMVAFYERWGFVVNAEIEPNAHGRGFAMHRPADSTKRPV